MEPKTKLMLSGFAGLAGTVWIGLMATIASRQQQLVFNPIRVKEVDRPRSSGHRTRPVVLRSTDGTRLSGWLLSPVGLGRHPAVIYFGGRSEEVSWVARDAGTMFPGMTVLVMNYRGYGDSHGVPGERQMIEDGQMLFDWLAAHQQVDAARIAVVGRSLGSGVAVQLAAHRPVAALALITPYDSILAIAKRHFKPLPVSLLLKHRFESVKYAEKVAAPVLVLRAQTDDVVPHLHTDQLVSKLATLAQDEIVPDSDHYNIPYLPETQKRIAAFLRSRFFQMAAAPVLAASACVAQA
ncbi:alpha/beta hydrolase [Noviherbaspirillum massiliense]|uniref:alpha/beta hydrolase n=1 Tax=Noviherbaspirillum massiliense TaxID=1465823 RepID=UPI00035C7816|nr:alpha/beta hydrolase [Noviherbaspirillum massiliense]